MKRGSPNIGALSSKVDPEVRNAIYELRDFMRELAAEQGGLPASKYIKDAVPWEAVKKKGSSLKDIADHSHDSVSGITQSDDTSTDPTGGKHVTDVQVKKYEDHRTTINANPHTTAHSQLQTIEQADDTSSNTDGGKHVTNALVKKYEDHRNASQDVHGIGSGNSVVGTGTAQEITNKKYGGATNYSEFEADGTLKMNGDATVWDDVQFGVSSGKVGVANNPNWEALTSNTSAYSFDVDDYIDLGANEVFHGWKEGTDGSVHLHVAIKTEQNSGADRFAKFTVYLAYADVSEVWTETSVTAELTIPTGSAALKHFKIAMGSLTLTNNVLGTQIKPRLKRIAATGGTEYADSVFVTQVGIHFEMDTVGSRQAIAK